MNQLGRSAPAQSPGAEDAYFAAHRCDWIDGLIHAVTHAVAILPRAPVTMAPVRAKLA
jgi:hypothetical protein